MKYLRLYEDYTSNKKDKLRINDYVICINSDSFVPDDINYFIENNIGKYVRFDNTPNIDLRYIIKYDNPPKSFTEYYNRDFMYFERGEIIDYSTSKDELEIILTSKKYNL